MKGIGRVFVIFVIVGLTCRSGLAETGPGAGTGAGAATPEALRILTRDTSAIGGPALRHGASYEASTGTPVKVAQVHFADLYERIMLGFVNG
ncbi:MAG: hypothetical protein V2I67_18930 [Thermoanaerobaculales bacterium]|jgi:multiple sugar transport system substrate-binding protein|nr:hypothetical protein [Thermoanaerobaculales bacterium]